MGSGCLLPFCMSLPLCARLSHHTTTMNHTITVDTNKKLLIVTYRDTVTLQDRKKAVTKGVQLIEEHGLIYFLVDFRMATIELAAGAGSNDIW